MTVDESALNHQEEVNKQTARLLYDVGDIFEKTALPAALNSLSVEDKYGLLKHHQQPSLDQEFPTQYLSSCNCAFRPVWLSSYAWMA